MTTHIVYLTRRIDGVGGPVLEVMYHFETPELAIKEAVLVHGKEYRIMAAEPYADAVMAAKIMGMVFDSYTFRRRRLDHLLSLKKPACRDILPPEINSCAAFDPALGWRATLIACGDPRGKS